MTTGPKKKKPTRREEMAKPLGVGDILASITKTTQLGKRLKEAQIWEQWPSLAGPKLCIHGNPVVVKDRTLFIEAYSAVWVSNFAYHKWDIIRRVNRMAGHELISDVHVSLQKDDEPMPEKPQGRGKGKKNE